MCLFTCLFIRIVVHANRTLCYAWVVFLSFAHPLCPLVGVVFWPWCFNTIGLQWCCSSSLTLLAPPTGPVLPTLLLLCLSGSAPCSRQATYGWPMRRWRLWQPPLKRSVPLWPSPLLLDDQMRLAGSMIVWPRPGPFVNTNKKLCSSDAQWKFRLRKK